MICLLWVKCCDFMVLMCFFMCFLCICKLDEGVNRNFALFSYYNTYFKTLILFFQEIHEHCSTIEKKIVLYHFFESMHSLYTSKYILVFIASLDLGILWDFAQNVQNVRKSWKHKILIKRPFWLLLTYILSVFVGNWMQIKVF